MQRQDLGLDAMLQATLAVFSGTHTGEGGPVPPTGKSVAADYVYVMQFDGDRIRHMTKIWNDVVTLTLRWGGCRLLGRGCSGLSRLSARLPMNR